MTCSINLANNHQTLTVTQVSNCRVNPVRYTCIGFKNEMIIMNLTLNWEMCNRLTGCLLTGTLAAPHANDPPLPCWSGSVSKMGPKLSPNLGIFPTYKNTGSKTSNLVFTSVLLLSLMSIFQNPNLSQSNGITDRSKNMCKALCQVLWGISEKHPSSTHPLIHPVVRQSIYSFNIYWPPTMTRHWSQRWTKYSRYYEDTHSPMRGRIRWTNQQTKLG